MFTSPRQLLDTAKNMQTSAEMMARGVCLCVPLCFTFLPPGEQVSGGGVLVIFRGLEPQLEGDEPRILKEKHTRLVLLTKHTPTPQALKKMKIQAFFFLIKKLNNNSTTQTT